MCLVTKLSELVGSGNPEGSICKLFSYSCLSADPTITRDGISRGRGLGINSEGGGGVFWTLNYSQISYSYSCFVYLTVREEVILVKEGISLYRRETVF